ncbi:MAG: SAM-dependent methyltransferase, partial [Planctomycetota bacterium]
WNHFWQEGVSPWDLGQAHPELESRLADLGEPRRVYVPGCGAGHDALFLASAGWRVTAVDHADQVQPHLRPGLDREGSRFLLRDAFELAEDETYDLWWDHTFFCAIPPELRETWGKTVIRAMPTGGTLAALVFPYGKDLQDGGPPYGISAAEMQEVLGSRATLRLDEPVKTPGRKGGERYALFQIASANEER